MLEKSFLKVGQCLRYFVAVASLAIVASSHAGVLIVWTQDGSDVLASYSGTMGVDASSYNQGSDDHFVGGGYFYNIPQILFGIADHLTANGTSIASATPSSYSSDVFALDTDFGQIAGPLGFTADTVVSGWMRFENTTLSAMGAVFATDFVVLQTADLTPVVTYSNVPEPSTYALLALGAVGVFLALRRREVAV